MGLLTGFLTIATAVGCGVLLAHRTVLDARGQRTLAEIAFYVCTPALMVVTISDTSVVVPTLLVQVLVVQPLALAYLDRRADCAGAWLPLRRIATSPLTVASVLGVVLAATGQDLPPLVEPPVRLLAGMAIPAMLLSYGAALRLSPPMGRTCHAREVATATGLKLVLMPLVAYGVARIAGLDGATLLGVVLTAALPTAQNIFLHATRYQVGEDIARETILVTTLGSVPVVLGLTVLLA
jgi:malonate transporter